MIKLVKKRDGRTVPFAQDRITYAVFRAMRAAQEGELARDPERVSFAITKALRRQYKQGRYPDVESIQELVEKMLITMGFAETAQAYKTYRYTHARLRKKTSSDVKKFKNLVIKSKKYFRNQLAEFIYYRTYSRWIEEKGRRETWVETVDRYMEFMKENLGQRVTDKEYSEIRSAILHQEVMPSMRLMWSAGKAARSTNVAAYNCAYIAPTSIDDFSEIMYLLMCGTGVGFSVERQVVNQLPIIKFQTKFFLPIHVISDSKEGWADALKIGLHAWFDGKDVEFDFSQIRPAGARLKTMGGRSSGPEPLRALLIFTRKMIFNKQGEKLEPINVHDIICKIGEIAVMGGVRRSALISLSDLDDKVMRSAKTGRFFINNPQRSIANNSVVYNRKPSKQQFLAEWRALKNSGTGERGIFNRGSLPPQLPKRRWRIFKNDFATCGTNPCGEIILKSKQFCNLSEVVARPNDTEKTLLEKIRIATILGTYQATITSFPYLSDDWKNHCEEERLLGVSITGQWDCPAVRTRGTLQRLYKEAIVVNKKYARRFGINLAAAITCVKPSGTVSQLVDSASGMHTKYAQYYIRRIRIATNDPLFAMLKDRGFPYHEEAKGKNAVAKVCVLEFLVKAPRNAVLKDQLSALEQLEYWKVVKTCYTEHNPSVTIYVGKDEWDEVAEWLYNNWDKIGGLSFLPRSEHVYELAPYEEITKQQYDILVKALPKIDFSELLLYELSDTTTGAKELACVGNACEIDPEEGSVPKA